MMSWLESLEDLRISVEIFWFNVGHPTKTNAVSIVQIALRYTSSSSVNLCVTLEKIKKI